MRFLRRPLLVLGAACTLVITLSGQTVRVLSVSGEATLQAPGESAPRVVKKGDTIVVGTRIVTGEGARVILTPLPGVNSIIAPRSDVVVERVSSSTPPGGKSTVHSAVLELKTGAVTTDLKTTPGVELDYGVRTARGLAGARGTTYTVGINSAGVQTIVVADGRISVTLANGRSLSLVPGQVSITRTDGSTQAVSSAGELSTSDHAIADNWMEITLEALAEAVEQGVDIDPAALDDALRAAAELGIEIDAETQSMIDSARDTLIERQEQAALESALGSTGSTTTTPNTDSRTLVTEQQQSGHSPATDPYLAAREAYANTLDASRRSRFLALSDPVQRLLVRLNEPAYTAYALDPVGETQYRPDDALLFAGGLPTTTRAAFLARPDSVRDLLVALADPTLTTVVLSPSGFDSPPTDADLSRNLAGLLSLSPENRALFKTFAGGATYSSLETAPGPYDWSDAAWTRTRNSFTALPSGTQSRILSLGAAESLFDYSATFIEAAFNDYDSTLSATTRSALQEAGWGRHFADYFAREEIREVFTSAADFSTAERSVLRELAISPFAFSVFDSSPPPSLTEGAVASLDYSEGPDPRASLAHLATLSSADRALLAKLSPGDGILFLYSSGYYDEGSETYVTPTYAQLVAKALVLARSFDAAQLGTLRDLGLGYQLINYAREDNIWVGDSSVPVRERFAYILGLYAGLSPAQQELARDLRLFSSYSLLSDLNLDAASLGSALNTLANLHPKTRDFLASQSSGLDLFNLARGSASSGAYSLTAIDSLLSSLTLDELATLRELRPGSDLFYGTTSDGGLISSADLKAFLGFVRGGLNDRQRFMLNELGITKHHNDRKGLFFSDQEGLARLLQAYADLPSSVRVATRQLDPYEAYGKHHTGPSFFFASDNGYDYTVSDVSFASPGDLHVGAVRRLSLYRSGSDYPVTFQVAGEREHDVFLRASTLIDLHGVAFSANVRSITMEAATINLASLDFPEGSVVSLNSKLGGGGTGNKYPNFGSSVPGRVNFLFGVSYGGAANEMNSESTFDQHSRGNIVIGTLQNRAPLPAYTPPVLQSIAR